MDLVTLLLTMHNQIKVLHWQTKSYEIHKATDFAYEELEELIDQFIETYQGNKPRIVSEEGFTIKLTSNPNPEVIIREYMELMVDTVPTFLDKHDTDLLNLRDGMLGVLRKTLYLLSLR